MNLSNNRLSITNRLIRQFFKEDYWTNSKYLWREAKIPFLGLTIKILNISILYKVFSVTKSSPSSIAF